MATQQPTKVETVEIPAVLQINAGTNEDPIWHSFDLRKVLKLGVAMVATLLAAAIRNLLRDAESRYYNAKKMDPKKNPAECKAAWAAYSAEMLARWEDEGFSSGGGVRLSDFVVEARLRLKKSKSWKEETQKINGYTRDEALKLGEKQLREWMPLKSVESIEETLRKRAEDLSDFDF